MDLQMPRPKPFRARGLNSTRILMSVMIAIGALMAVIALGVFLTQGSQITVTASVLSEHCHPQVDLATGQGETRCDAVVQFTTTAGRIITTTVTDAFPSEFRGSGPSKTIDLRYDSSDPTQPFKQSNYMSVDTFVLLLAFACAAVLFGSWGFKRAPQLAQQAALRRSGRSW